MAKKYEIEPNNVVDIIAAARAHGNYFSIEISGGPVKDGWGVMLTWLKSIFDQAAKLDQLLRIFGPWRLSGVVALIDGGFALPLACAEDLYAASTFDQCAFGKFVDEVERQGLQVAEQHRGLQEEGQLRLKACDTGTSQAQRISKVLPQLSATKWEGAKGTILLPHGDGGALGPLRMQPLENVQLIASAAETKDCRGKIVAIASEMGLVLLDTGVRLAPRSGDKLRGIEVGDMIQCATQRRSRSLQCAEACTDLLLLQPELDNFASADDH
jgi:hypothetical protein